MNDWQDSYNHMGNYSKAVKMEGGFIVPVICLEGASGVGKSTTACELSKRYSAYTVPEVNVLFERPDPMPRYWYFERQAERWQIAQEKLVDHEIVILDGDVFQPLWYNWAYNF